MRIFSTLKHLNKWHYINAKNVQKYLATFPYLQKSQYFAVCYYCHNPIKIVQRVSTKKDKLSFYGIHLKKPINGFDYFNKDKLNHCLLNKKAQLMVFSPLSKPQFDLAEVDHNVLRKDLCYYTGIYFSLKLTEQFLNENPDIPYYRNADSFNLPFIVLLNAKRLNLKYRKIANPRLIKAIEKNQKTFKSLPVKSYLSRLIVVQNFICISKIKKSKAATYYLLKYLLLKAAMDQKFLYTAFTFLQRCLII